MEIIKFQIQNPHSSFIMSLKTIFKSSLLISIILFSENPLCSQTNLSELFESALPSVLKIETFDANDNPLASGTGFFINSEGKGISNLHVFRGAGKAQITTSYGKTYAIKDVWFKSDSLDIVTFNIVNSKNETFPFLEIEKSAAKTGEEVFTIGNPIGLDFTISNGIISSVRNQVGFGQIIQTNAPISAGSSGSPLINMDGLAIGVVTFTFAEGQNLNFAISLIDKELDAGLNKYQWDETTIIQASPSQFESSDDYPFTQSTHAIMCMNFKFNIDYRRNMIKGNSKVKWQIEYLGRDGYKPIPSYLHMFSDENEFGKSILIEWERNLGYIITYGSIEASNEAIILISRIVDGESTHIYNDIVEKTRIRNSNNRYLEAAGNENIDIIIVDKMFIESIVLMDFDPYLRDCVFVVESY